MHPNQLVAVDQLLGRTRSAVEDMGDVELIGRAAREKDCIAEGSIHRMGEDLRCEHSRPSRHARHVACLRAEEPLDGVVDEGPVLRRKSGLDERVELGVETAEQDGVEEALHDDGAVALECGDDALGICVNRAPLHVHADPP